MTFMTETKAPVTVEGTLSNLLASLKTNSALSAQTGASGFASLLAQTSVSATSSDALAPSMTKAIDKAVAPLRSEDEPRDVVQETRGDDDTPVRTTSEEPRKKVQDAKPERDNDCKEAKTNADEPVEAQTEEASEVTVEDVVAAAGDAVQEEDDTDDLLDTEMQALLAALVPLDGLVSKNVASATQGANAPTSEAIDLACLTPEQKTALTSLQNLQNIKEHIEAQGPAAEGKAEAQIAQDLSGVLEQIASEIATLKDVTPRAMQAVKGAASLEGTALETLVTAGTATAETATQDGLSSQFESPSRQFRDDRGANVLMPATNPNAAPNAAAMAGSTMLTTQSAGETAASTATVGATGTSQPVSLSGEGIKTAGSYDFASQLSAARVTKGGAAGLPQAIEQVAVQLHKAVKEGVEEITVQLKPAELGKIEITLKFGENNSVTGKVVADNQATLNMLQKDSDSLQRALQEAGLQADAGCMEFSLRQDASRFAQEQNNKAANGNALESALAADAVDAINEMPTGVETYYLTPGHVNIHV